MARFFQHLDKNDEAYFGKVTELAYIDDTDPDMVMYHFKDGSKCNKEFISNINTADAFGKCVMVEVENTRNIWKIDKVVLEYKEQTATNAQGEVVTIPDINMMRTDGTFAQAGTRYNFTPPKHTDKPLGSLGKYYLSYIDENGADNEVSKNLPEYLKKKTAKKEPAGSNRVIETEVVTNPNTDSKELNDLYTLQSNEVPVIAYVEDKFDFRCQNVDITADDLRFSFIAKDCDKQKSKYNTDFESLKITGENNEILFDGTFKELKEKLAKSNKSVEKIKTDDDTVSPEITNPAIYSLVSNMIQAANKEECEVDMGMILNLPPTTLYDVLKSVYGKEYTDMFVVYLAYNLPGELLRQAIATGLKAYYEPDFDTNNPEIKES